MQFDNAIQLIVSRMFFRPDIEIYRYRGLSVLVDHAGGDQNGTRAVLVSEMYRRFLPYLRSQPTGNVVDFGANGGGFPLLLKAYGCHLQRAVCVEMNPNTYQRLCFNAFTNIGADIATCLNVALASKPGRLQLSLGRGSTADSLSKSSRDLTSSTSRPYDIAAWTFDDIASTYFAGQEIDICKMDIEGAEYEALLDANPHLIRQVRFLLIEIHRMNGRDPRALAEWLAAAGLRRIAGDSDICGVHLYCRRDIDVFGSTGTNKHVLACHNAPPCTH